MCWFWDLLVYDSFLPFHANMTVPRAAPVRYGATLEVVGLCCCVIRPCF